MTSAAENTTYAVDPARLAWGQWCHKTDRQIGRGDIHASYSADRIGMNQPIRQPFPWKGSLWVCVSFSSAEAEAYRLTYPGVFSGEATTYHRKTGRAENAEAARNDPLGFYHGMTVKHGGRAFVLCGPPARFAPGKTEQLHLF